MILHVRDYLGNLLNFGWFQVYQIVRDNIILKVPQMDSEVVRRHEVFSIRTDTQRINIIVMAVPELRFFNSFVILTFDLGSRENYLVVPNLAFRSLSYG